MAEYYCIFIFIGSLSLFYRGKRDIQKRWMYLGCFVCALFGGFGDWDGFDWSQYYVVFQDSRWDNIIGYHLTNLAMMEPGYMFLNILVKTIFGKFTIFHFLLVWGYMFSYTKFYIKYTKYPLLLFVITFFLGIRFIIIRQMLSSSITIWAYKYIKERNFIKFLIVIAIASSIHMSSIVFLPCYWLFYLNANYIICNLIYIGAFFVSSFFRDYFLIVGAMFGGGISAKIDVYSNMAEDDRVFGLGSLLFNVALLNVSLYIKNKQKDLESSKWLNFLLWPYVIGMSINMVFGGAMSELARLSSQFLWATILVWDFIAYYCLTNKPIIKKAFMIFLIYYLYSKFVNMPFFEDGNFYVPYTTIFI